MIRLSTLGSVDLRAPDNRVLHAVLAQPKRVGLLVYLAAARPTGFHRRDRLLGLFWPELDDARARDALSQALRFLRQSLGAQAVLTRGGDEVGIDHDLVWCDAVAFRAALDEARPVDALQLYRGDFLDGVFVDEASGFEEWVESERAVLRELAARGARQLAEQHEGQGAHTVGVGWGRRAVELAPDDERAFRRLLGLLDRAGDRAGALQAYDEFARRLRAEYGAEPAAETTAMADAIRRASPIPVAPVDTPPERPVLSPDAPRAPRAGQTSSGAPLPVGSSLANGSYVIEGILGSGGMATVYLAHDVRHERRVAVKVLRPEIAAAVGAKGLSREIRIAASLQHPHIVPLFDSGESDGRLFFVMPRVPGESLRARLMREPVLPIEIALRIAQDVADALAYAHGRGIVHRDIKPENILLSSDPASGDFYAMVADFGVAKGIDVATSLSADVSAQKVSTSDPILEPASNETSTLPGVIRGTAAYMSPEQASGQHDYDGRSDIFSLGCVLYEMIAGVPAYKGPSPEAVMVRRLADAPVELRAYRASVPDSVVQVVRKALAIAPADRFRSAAELVEALKAIAAEKGAPRPIPARSNAVASKTLRIVVPLAVVAAIAVAVGQAYVRRTNVALDDSLVAVAPFEIYDPRLALWREGFMDILASGLDGAGRIRTVSPTVVARGWSGGADRSSGTALANRTGARYVVLGRIVDAGADSIRATVTVLDAKSHNERAVIDARELRERPDRLADTLSSRLVQELGESLEHRTRVRSLGAASPLALKAFLRGEYYLRRTQWDSAAAAYEEALAFDSSFALANWRMKTASWSRSWGPDTVGDSFALAAGRLNRGLAPRDSLLITVDSLWASLTTEDTGTWSRMRRLGTTLDEAVRRYPEDPWIWYKIGEARWHLPLGLDFPLSQHLAAFDRAIALDSGFALAYVTHAVELGLILEGPQRALAYTKGYRLVALPGVEDSAAILTERLLDPARAHTPETKQWLDAASADVLYRVAANLDMWFDADETAIGVARRLAQSRRGSSRFLDRETVQLRLARILAVRGHLSDAWREARASVPLDVPTDEAIELFADVTLNGTVPPPIADSVFRIWTRTSPRGSVFALGWWASRRDTAAIARAGEAFRRWSRTTTHRQLGVYGMTAARAYASIARGDTSVARRELAQLADSLCADCYLDWLKRAELLLANAELDSARRQLERVMTYAWNVSAYPFASLYLGRLEERAGRAQPAMRAYAVAANAWTNADSVLSPYVAEARAGVKRLRR